MDFAKWQGLGNDFLVANVKERSGCRSLSDLARIFCNRHCGVGADGILFYQPTSGDREADFSVLIFNADGSRAEMSGNGVRCLAAHVVHFGEYQGNVPRVRTVSGIKLLTLERRLGFRYDFKCSMGHPVFESRLIPALIGAGKDPVLDFPLELNPGSVQVTLSSMGNPHCTTFWPELAVVPIAEIGPRIESHPAFPNKTNVEFAQILDRHNIRVRFWERGVGTTLSSGTGSSAAAVAAILRGLAESPVTVETELGTLLVEWTPGRELSLTGPAEFVFGGSYPAADLED